MGAQADRSSAASRGRALPAWLWGDEGPGIAAIVLALFAAAAAAVIGESDDVRYPAITAIVGLVLLWLLRRQLSEAEDQTVALLLWCLFFAAAEVITVSLVADSEEIRDVGLTAVGGILLLLGAYFTARNLRQTARSSFLDRLMHGSELLSAGGDPVKQAAGRQTLLRLKALAQDEDEKAAADAVLRADAVSRARKEDAQGQRRDKSA